MTELEKMQRAKCYIDRLANGIDPIHNTPAPDGDIINNVRVSRCLFYVSYILEQVIKNNGVICNPQPPEKGTFDIDVRKFLFSDVPISISEIAKRLNAAANADVSSKLSPAAITSWLVEIGALEIKSTADGEKVKRPTQQGNALGITVETRVGANREYDVIVYSREAQQFILDNVESIACAKSAAKKYSGTYENQGRAWTPDQDERLADLFRRGVTVSEAAEKLRRSNGAIRSRLKKLGLIGNNAGVK